MGRKSKPGTWRPDMLIRRIGVLGLLAFTSTFLAVAASSGVLDQSFIPGDHSGDVCLGADINEGFGFVAQTFTADASGQLEGIKIAVKTFTTARLNVSIRTAVGQTPTRVVLGSVLIDADDTAQDFLGSESS
jgi:hypothetical protein